MGITINEITSPNGNVMIVSATKNVPLESVGTTINGSSVPIVIAQAASIGEKGDPGIYVSATPPPDPHENMLWLKI